MQKVLKREKVIESPNDIKNIIKLIDKFGLDVIKIGIGGEYRTMTEYIAKNGLPALSNDLIIELKETKLFFTTKYYEGKPCTYVFDLNKKESFACSGLRCFTEFSKAYKLPKASSYENQELNRWFNEERGTYACSATPIIGFNPKYENMIIKDCWEYDINSAYSSAMFNKMPDLYHPLFSEDHKIKEGYIGFYLNDHLTMVEAGGYADVSFPLIETPEKLKEFCKKWYNIKKSSTGVARETAKAMLNLPIGYTQRFNPFLRSYIVHRCNSKIFEIIDKDSLFWNTDAIFSKRRRTDLPIGDEIGQFKEIHYKMVRYIGNVYQLDNEIPVYRGIPKHWFKVFESEHGRPFDLFLDDLPKKANIYDWDWDKLELRRNYGE